MQTSDVILHIGYPKVASTWLQRRVFTADFGFQTPWATHANTAVEHFVLTPKPSFDPEKIWDDFSSACAGKSGRPVISHEALAGDPIVGRYDGFETAERLAATFPGARVIVLFRAQEAYANSAWREHVRRGGLTPIDAYIGADGVAPGYRPFCPHEFLRYDELIGAYADLFGRERVLALPLEAMNGGEVVGNLAAFLGNDQLLQCEKAPVYQSAKAGTTRMVRQLNRFWPYDPTQRRQRSFVSRQAARIDKRAPKSWQDACKKKDEEKIAALLEGRFAESNRRLQSLTPVDLSQFPYQI